MRVATAAYPMDFLSDWQGYATKLTHWVSEAAGQGAGLLVFPEYGAMELATLAGAEAAGDLEASLHAVSERIPDADDLHSDLAARFGVHILAASAPVFDGGARPVNRARFFAPGGGRAHQDKQIMTRFERETWDVVPGGPLALFDTALGRIGILICYDAEFPLLGRALAEADLILVPSCTEAASGYARVRIGAQARALENQCVTVMSSTVGSAAWSPAVDENTGAGGVFGPPDTGFPSDGVLALGKQNKPGWTYADVAPEAIAHVRRDGVVLNASHWSEQSGRDATPKLITLR
ncbi:carbon-nitrogen hydrolase family protein [Pseudaestuariivita atlantica]|uniref:Amidohydrolase n=1 Tax=Pseudaestuariivita atlantica TaxID=1317121 RepID=A0A0L1JU18_9RHOB|nr:carbon-nitrogen hydrolase family protein [Pseudaestuariivita atlantica]KNG95269.1 amidohydrolase [Pseudaestuariivita atlantica]